MQILTACRSDCRQDLGYIVSVLMCESGICRTYCRTLRGMRGSLEGIGVSLCENKTWSLRTCGHLVTINGLC
jgi:hypothetical protein